MSDDEGRLAPGPASEAVAYGVGDKIKFETSGLVPKDWALVLEKHERFVSVRVGEHEWSFDPDDPEDFKVTDVKRAATRPIAEPGDLIMVGGRWREVVGVAPNGLHPVIQDGAERRSVAILDITAPPYTKAEQQANGARVHGFAGPDFARWYSAERSLDEFECPWDYELAPEQFSESESDSDVCFLTPEATAALGEFHPVPDRAIVPGDVVRTHNGHVGVVRIAPSGSSAVTLGYGAGMVRREILSHVTPEDPAYHQAKERFHAQRYNEATGADKTSDERFAEMTERPKERGEDCTTELHKITKDGPEWREPDPAPMPCEGKVCNCHEITSLDPAPSIGSGASALAEGETIPESWDLITAGDGRTFERVTSNTGYRWRPVGADASARHFTDAEILALGPVRRAVVVTLPDGGIHPDSWSTLNGRVAIPTQGYTSPENARAFAAQVLAAALHAEEGR